MGHDGRIFCGTHHVAARVLWTLIGLGFLCAFALMMFTPTSKPDDRVMLGICAVGFLPVLAWAQSCTIIDLAAGIVERRRIGLPRVLASRVPLSSYKRIETPFDLSGRNATRRWKVVLAGEGVPDVLVYLNCDEDEARGLRAGLAARLGWA